MQTDPVGSVRGLYEWLGEDLTPDVEQRMRAWIASEPAWLPEKPFSVLPSTSRPPKTDAIFGSAPAMISMLPASPYVTSPSPLRWTPPDTSIVLPRASSARKLLMLISPPSITSG